MHIFSFLSFPSSFWKEIFILSDWKYDDYSDEEEEEQLVQNTPSAKGGNFEV